MPTFEVDKEEITIFEFEDKYLFKEYFDQDDLFDQLREYYNSDKYRFEIPEEELSKVGQTLDKFFYELKPVDKMRYCVIQERDEYSPDIIRNTVITQNQGKNKILLMKDKMSVRQAIEKGASPMQKSDVSMEKVQWEIDGS